MTTPLISVIVPVYRVEEYLERCVKSILSQTYKNLEVILVDDGSPDQCPAICDACAEKDARVKVIHQENKGLSGARNAGIDAASGEYLAFVDSDDYVSPHFIEELYQLLQDTGCAIGQCRFSYVKGDGLVEEGDSAFCIYRGESLMEQLYGPEEKATYFVVAWNKLYHRSLFDGIRYPEGRIHEDEATTYRIFDRVKRAAVIDACMYGYFTGNDSITRGNFSKKRLDWAWAVHERILFLESHSQYEQILPAALKAFADGCIDLYFKCVRFLPDSKKEQKEMRGYVKESLKRCARLGGFPSRTANGYRLFLLAPGIYRRLLNY